MTWCFQSKSRLNRFFKRQADFFLNWFLRLLSDTYFIYLFDVRACESASRSNLYYSGLERHSPRLSHVAGSSGPLQHICAARHVAASAWGARRLGQEHHESRKCYKLVFSHCWTNLPPNSFHVSLYWVSYSFVVGFQHSPACWWLDLEGYNYLTSVRWRCSLTDLSYARQLCFAMSVTPVMESIAIKYEFLCDLTPKCFIHDFVFAKLNLLKTGLPNWSPGQGRAILIMLFH